MRLTRNRRSRWSCGHRGFGAHCHRCQEADRLESIAAGKAKPASGKQRTNRTVEAFKGWTKDRFLEEAKRLRSDSRASRASVPQLP